MPPTLFPGKYSVLTRASPLRFEGIFLNMLGWQWEKSVSFPLLIQSIWERLTPL